MRERGRYLASKPYSVIYITVFVTPTNEGDVFNFMAQDGYSKFAFNPVICKEFNDFEEMVNAMVTLNNNIRENFDRSKHANKTTFVTNLPQPLVDVFKGMLIDDTIVVDEEATNKAFKDLFEQMNIFNQDDK